MKIREFLREDRWCRQAFALNYFEKATTVTDSSARKWCLVGALRICYPISEQQAIRRKILEVIEKPFDEDLAVEEMSIAWFNDNVAWFRIVEILERIDV